MRVLLSTSPHVRHVAVLQSGFQPDPSVTYSFAPVGLLSLQAVLRRDRPTVECSIYDLNRRIRSNELPLDSRIYEMIATELVMCDPDVLGMMTECDSYHHVLQICAAVKRLRPQCQVVLGGPHASAVAMKTMERAPYVDAIVIGEGELTFVDLVDSIEIGSPVAGAMTRTSDGAVLDGGTRALVARLDDLPIPAYDCYEPDPGEEIFVEAGRGCPFRCTFCSTAPYWQRKHRIKSAARIVQELKLIKALYGARRVHFTHDLFTADRRWVLQVCEALKAADLGTTWTCSARTDTVDPELLAQMAAAGCRAIYFGIESGSERVLRDIDKAVPLDESWDAVAACRVAGITPNAGFIVGVPTEDATSFDDTFSAFETALRIGCKPAHIFAFCPFAQSSIYATLREVACDGHFVDLPLGAEADSANRAWIGTDRDLFGAYYRPRLPQLTDLIAGADEFSPLVEATLPPSLALADLMGGMSVVYRRWNCWIQARNAAQGVPAWRRAYGSPAQFASFLVEELDRLAASGQARAAARLLQTNLRVGEMPPATTMANHRSLVMRDAQELKLSDRVGADTVVAALALEYDAMPALSGDMSLEYAHEQTFLVWQQSAPDSVRLLRVNEHVFRLLEHARSGARTLSHLLLEAMSADADDGTGGWHGGQMWTPLQDAVSGGLLTVEKQQ